MGKGHPLLGALLWLVGLSHRGSRIIAICIMRLPWYDSPTNFTLSSQSISQTF